MTEERAAGPGGPDDDPAGGGDPAELVRRALGGDRAAWDGIVGRFGDRVWAICRAYRLGPAEAADVYQQTWLRVLEHLAELRDPERLGAWIGTTCRHEALAALRRSQRLALVGDSGVLDRSTGPEDDPAAPVLAADRDAELWRAFQRLSPRCRQVLRVLVADADQGRPSYQMAAAALGIPVGSLGPTRARCLSRLREFLTTGIGGPPGASSQ